MPDPTDAATKSAWFTELLQVQEKIASARCANMVGQTVRVLCEEIGKKGISGRTEGNLIVTFPAEETIVGHFARVKITQATNWMLSGELVAVE